MSTPSEVQEPTESSSLQPPRPAQLALLRRLALQRGETFAYPRTAAEASIEIGRLRARRCGSFVEAHIERRQVSRDLAFAGDAASVRGSEIVGYGASARWR